MAITGQRHKRLTHKEQMPTVFSGKTAQGLITHITTKKKGIQIKPKHSSGLNMMCPVEIIRIFRKIP